MARFVNLTPHEITILKPNGEEFKIPPSGRVFRLEEEDIKAMEVDGIEVRWRRYKIPDNIHEIFSDTFAIYIVSLPALMAIAAAKVQGEKFPERIRVVAPDTGAGAIRDEQGRIVAVRGFVTL